MDGSRPAALATAAAAAMESWKLGETGEGVVGVTGSVAVSSGRALPCFQAW